MARSNEKPIQNETKMNQMKMKFKHLLKIKRFLETIKMCQLQKSFKVSTTLSFSKFGIWK